MFSLDQVVPWGRSFDEYVRTFALGEAELGLTILGCADGPANFNAEAARRRIKVTPPIRSIDSIPAPFAIESPRPPGGSWSRPGATWIILSGSPSSPWKNWSASE
jgi:hypothetical protein